MVLAFFFSKHFFRNLRAVNGGRKIAGNYDPLESSLLKTFLVGNATRVA